MSIQQLERRIKAIEDELARLKAELKRGNGHAPRRGWRGVLGSFAGDPLHKEE